MGFYPSIKTARGQGGEMSKGGLGWGWILSYNAKNLEGVGRILGFVRQGDTGLGRLCQ